MSFELVWRCVLRGNYVSHSYFRAYVKEERYRRYDQIQVLHELRALHMRAHSVAPGTHSILRF